MLVNICTPTVQKCSADAKEVMYVVLLLLDFGFYITVVLILFVGTLRQKAVGIRVYFILLNMAASLYLYSVQCCTNYSLYISSVRGQVHEMICMIGMQLTLLLQLLHTYGIAYMQQWALKSIKR